MNNEDLSTLSKSRAEALTVGADRFFTGVPCKHGHLADRYVSTTNCVACQTEHARRNGGWNARPSKEEYLEVVRQIVERSCGVLLSTQYVSAKSKLKVRCDQGHEFETTADSLKHERWCRHCKRKKHAQRMAEKLRS